MRKIFDDVDDCNLKLNNIQDRQSNRNKITAMIIVALLGINLLFLIFTPIITTQLQQSEYDRGFNNGFILGNSTGWEEGWNEGNSTGWEEGWNEGNSTGWNTGWLIGNSTGYIIGFLEGYNIAYEIAYNQGFADGMLVFTSQIASLNITISENFNITTINDSGNLYFNTTWDVRKMSFANFLFDIDMIREIYDYIEANNQSSIDIKNATDLYDKVGIEYVDSGLLLESYSDSWNLLDNWFENNRSIIGENIEICYKDAFIPTFKLFLYANNTIFDGTNFTSADDNPGFGFWFNTSIYFLMSNAIFDINMTNSLDIFKTYNENELILTELILDVDGLSYEIKGKLNDIDVTWMYITFF